MILEEKLKIYINEIKQSHSLTNRIKILLVSGKASFSSCGAKAIVDKLKNDYDFISFTDFSANPKLEDIEKGIELCRESKPDIVLAIGGGSTIDTAKIINFIAANDFGVKEYLANSSSFKINKPLPFIVAPTTAGTGSEVTHFAVLYVDGVKKSLAHQYLLTDYVILDYALTMDLPSAITASTAMDAFGQAIESYWSVASTSESDIYAKEAMQLCVKYIEQVVNNPTAESRQMMLEASNLSGKAINITMTTACHAISYSLSTEFGLAHGHAVAMTLAQVMELNYNVDKSNLNDSRGVDFVKSKIKDIWEIIGCSSSLEATEYFNNLMDNIYLSRSLREFNCTDTSLIADKVDLGRLANNPSKINYKDLNKLLKDFI